MPAMHTWGVLLAAGASLRMGHQKLLLNVVGEPMVRRAAKALLACNLTGVLVVLGRESEAVHAVLEDLNCSFVVNPDFQLGELPSSIALALQSLPTSADGALLTLADMPFVQEAHLRRVLAVGDERPVLSRYDQVTAPPHLVPRTWFTAVQDAIKEGRSKPLPTAFGNAAIWVDQPPEDLLDVDDEASYAAVQKRLSSIGGQT